MGLFDGLITTQPKAQTPPTPANAGQTIPPVGNSTSQSVSTNGNPVTIATTPAVTITQVPMATTNTSTPPVATTVAVSTPTETPKKETALNGDALIIVDKPHSEFTPMEEAKQPTITVESQTPLTGAPVIDILEEQVVEPTVELATTEQAVDITTAIEVPPTSETTNDLFGGLMGDEPSTTTETPISSDILEEETPAIQPTTMFSDIPENTTEFIRESLERIGGVITRIEHDQEEERKEEEYNKTKEEEFARLKREARSRFEKKGKEKEHALHMQELLTQELATAEAAVQRQSEPRRKKPTHA